MATKEIKNPRLDATIKVLGGFLINFNTWGLSLSFGSFQRYYTTDLLRGESQSTIAWIGTLSVALLMFGGIPSGMLHDRGWNRVLLIGGCFLICLGFFMLSLARTLAEVFLSQGVCLGLGFGLVNTPTMTNIVKSFTKHRALALGLCLCGSSIGGIIYPIMVDQLIGRVGFGWTVRAMALVVLCTCVIALLCLARDADVKPPEARSARDPEMFKDWLYGIYNIAGFLLFMSYYIPFLYIPAYGAHVGANQSLQYYLPAITNGAALIGRLGPAVVADVFGPLNALTGFVFIASILLLCWIAVESVAGLIVWAVFWGLTSGILIVLPNACIPLMAPSIKVLGTRMGVSLAFSGLGILIGSPIAGAIIDHDGFQGMQIFAGVIMFTVSLMALYITLTKRRQMRDQALGAVVEQSKASSNDLSDRQNSSKDGPTESKEQPLTPEEVMQQRV